MPSVQEFMQELAQEAPATRRVLERVPADRLDWRPHEKSMTLGGLAMHLAQLPSGITAIMLQDRFDVSQAAPRPDAATKDEIVAAFDAGVVEARERLAAMSEADLDTPWSLVAGDDVIMTITRGALLRTILCNHSYHHRGQLTVYLRELGVPLPAIYGPSADEQLFGPQRA